MPGIPPELCTRCKGYKKLCGLPTCPILEKFRWHVAATASIRGRRVEGLTPPSALVGESGYPRVQVYYMIPPALEEEEAAYHESPSRWAENREPLHSIIRLRSSMVAAGVRVPAKDPWFLYETEVSLAAVSTRPVDSEALLKRHPVPRLVFNGVTKPLGPSAPARRIRVEGSPSIPRALEKTISDDLKAIEAVKELYESGVDTYTIQRALSLGLIGAEKRRKLVPTRWAITAVDDMVSLHLRRKARDLREAGKVKVYYGEYLGNKFIVITMPGPGRIEWFETWHPAGVWTREASRPVHWKVYESPLGEQSSSDGGFSAARLSVLESIVEQGERADVVIIREILPSYYAPVGNWHIRETVRRALKSGPIAVNPSRKELREILRERAKGSLDYVENNSLLIGLKRRLAKLDELIFK